ncbi:Uncharacterized protein HZ326_18281 [Fusarium oxysporum f. sp. albedinis]|nr:Uncharacterized protein HZ326_18281 [Fusarium oxysporum f. sp. albedinis]
MLAICDELLVVSHCLIPSTLCIILGNLRRPWLLPTVNEFTCISGTHPRSTTIQKPITPSVLTALRDATTCKMVSKLVYNFEERG